MGGIAPRTLRNVSGQLQTDLQLKGSPFHPAISGTINVNGDGEIVPIGVKVADFEMRLLASPTAIEIAQLSAKSGDGSLSARGSLALRDNYSPGAIDAVLQFHQWPGITTQQ